MSDGAAALLILLSYVAIHMLVRWAFRKFDTSNRVAESEGSQAEIETEDKNSLVALDLTQKKWEEQRQREQQQREQQQGGQQHSERQQTVIKLASAIQSSKRIQEFALRYPKLKISLGTTCPKDLEQLLSQWISSRKTWQVDQVVDWVVSDYGELVKRAYYNRTCDLPTKSVNEWVRLVIHPEFWVTEKQYRTDCCNSGFPPDWSDRMKLVSWIDGGACRRCGVTVPDKDKQTHHIKPRSEGGTHEFENLALLCRDCHTCMPSRGHKEIRGFGVFHVSKNKTVHTVACRYAKNGRRQKINAMILKWKGYRMCKLCDPLTQHELNVAAWQPKIVEEFEKEKGKIVKELTQIMFEKA